MIHLRAEHVSFIYPDRSIHALKDVSFTVERGEYIAVLGANGSGKSTLARLIAGFLPCTSGRIELYTASAESPPLQNEPRVSVPPLTVPTGIVFQNVQNQIIGETAAADTAFGPENLGLDKPVIEKRCFESLSLVGLFDSRFEKTASLSQGQKQKLVLAGIAAMHPELMILDEALAMTDPSMRETVLDFLDERHKEGLTLIHVTHDLDEALRAERIIVLDDGVLSFDGSVAELKRKRNFIKTLFPPLVRENVSGVQKKGNAPCALRFSSVDFSYTANTKSASDRTSKAADSSAGKAAADLSADFSAVFKNFSLDIRAGELTAITGPSGSGKSTLFELACGLLKPDGGNISARGRPVLALQLSESALFEEFAADDAAFGPQNRGLSGETLRGRVQEAMNMCGLPFKDFADRRIHTLSGGEKRKLALAGIIALESEVYLFDEPTAGLDPKSRLQVMNILAALAESGKAVVFSTHRMDEAAFAERRIDIGRVKKEGFASAVRSSAAPRSSGAAGSSAKKNSAQDKGLQPVEEADTSLLDGLRRTSSGLYTKVSSPLHKLPPPAKILLFLSLFIASLCIQHIGALAVCTLIALIYARIARFSLLRLGGLFLKFVPWLILFALFQCIFFPAAEGEAVYAAFKGISLTPSKLRLSAATILHAAAALPLLTGFMYSCESGELLEGFKKLLVPLDKLGIKTKYLSFTFVLVFRFLPILADTASQIIKTQLIRGGLNSDERRGLKTAGRRSLEKSGRGIKKRKRPFSRLRSMLPLFVPLISQTLRRAEAFGETLDARYF
ncbi:ATP-binding cassette domain-containing protein [Treponema sp. HNW]|uniref:ATP-binding cassette domain-containing protein n=1 Tax=Treponema sp. HNW TaxID=3116654 RepID=UPI003D0C77B9